MLTFSFILTRISFRARSDIVLAMTSNKSWLAFAMEICSSVLALAIVAAWFPDGARSYIILTIFAFESRGAHAFIIFSFVDASSIVFTRFFCATLGIYLTCVSLETGSALAIKLFPFVDAFSFVLAQTLFLLCSNRARTNIIVAVGSGEPGLASTAVFGSLM